MYSCKQDTHFVQVLVLHFERQKYYTLHAHPFFGHRSNAEGTAYDQECQTVIVHYQELQDLLMHHDILES